MSRFCQVYIFGRVLVVSREDNKYPAERYTFLMEHYADEPSIMLSSEGNNLRIEVPLCD